MLTINQLSATQAAAVLGNLIELLQDAVDSGASVGFLPPLAAEVAAEYWRKTFAEVEQGQRLLLVAQRGTALVGAVQLALATQHNALHRAEVQKVMVHTRHRRQGIGRTLMAAIEESAVAAGRTLLVLDTRRGDISEPLYLQAGYQRAGVIPCYARSASGVLDDTVIYYRLLSGR
jgi:ribosomal protein S18 acetylase RimI-like enzyme